MMSDTFYIMEHDREADRIRKKTSAVLTSHHLDWMGLKHGQSFVDFGCATGEIVRAAASISGSGEVCGIDGNDGMLKAAQQESGGHGASRIRYVRAQIAGPGSTELPDNSFDHAWTRFFLEYQKNPVDVIREMRRVVKSGGHVTLIDIDGNCVWHHPLPAQLKETLSEVVSDLGTTGFDPYIGSKLFSYAQAAGLSDIRQSIEPYHYIVGRPEGDVADQWRRKILGIKENYTTNLFPHKSHLSSFFDDLLEFILSAETMTWSNLYLVQGGK
jgi:ubiquinone/menaquinone biosynthesis C-methylase UbiE